MIQYSISLTELENRIEAHKPGWLVRSQGRTAALANVGHYDESSSIWSEIKEVYMVLQHSKCAYCERQLESAEFGRIEHDLEHFRPKSKAKPWKLSRKLQNAGVVLTMPVVGDEDPGYHLLAYHPFNYCAACKPCNSTLKSTYFPISSTRNSNGADPTLLQSEQPLLVYPIGDFDVDPSQVIKFHGLSPMAIGAGNIFHRGLTTIAFFKLDDQRRKYLFRQRAESIATLFSFLEHSTDQNKTQAERDIYLRLVYLWTQPQRAHTNCCRSFRDLYFNDYNGAKRVFEAATKYLDTISS